MLYLPSNLIHVVHVCTMHVHAKQGRRLASYPCRLLGTRLAGIYSRKCRSYVMIQCLTTYTSQLVFRNSILHCPDPFYFSCFLGATSQGSYQWGPHSAPISVSTQMDTSSLVWLPHDQLDRRSHSRCVWSNIIYTNHIRMRDNKDSA